MLFKFDDFAIDRVAQPAADFIGRRTGLVAPRLAQGLLFAGAAFLAAGVALVAGDALGLLPGRVSIGGGNGNGKLMAALMAYQVFDYVSTARGLGPRADRAEAGRVEASSPSERLRGMPGRLILMVMCAISACLAGGILSAPWAQFAAGLACAIPGFYFAACTARSPWFAGTSA